MSGTHRSGRRCSAVRADGKRCRQKAINGLEVPLCPVHAFEHKGNTGGSPRHGFYSKGEPSGFEYLRRVRPDDFVRGGGLASIEGAPLEIREREMDVYPLEPERTDIDVAIAALVHKMEILDALIFRAEEHGLDIVTLLGLYLAATTRLGHLIRERHEMSNREGDDLLGLLERANELLERGEGDSGSFGNCTAVNRRCWTGSGVRLASAGRAWLSAGITVGVEAR